MQIDGAMLGSPLMRLLADGGHVILGIQGWFREGAREEQARDKDTGLHDGLACSAADYRAVTQAANKLLLFNSLQFFSDLFASFCSPLNRR